MHMCRGNAVTYGPCGTHFVCACRLTRFLPPLHGVSGDVMGFFSSTFVYIYTCTSYIVRTHTVKNRHSQKWRRFALKFYRYTSRLYVCALCRFNYCKILHANGRYRRNRDRNIHGMTYVQKEFD